MDTKTLTCPECGSTNIEASLMQENHGATTVTKSKTKTKSWKGHGCLWWILIGWWWIFVDAFIWVAVFPLRLVIELLRRKKTKSKSDTTTVSEEVAHIEYKTVCLCRNCGHHWTK